MSVSAVAIVTVAELWSQPRCPTTEEWLRKMWCSLHTGIILAPKRNEAVSFVKQQQQQQQKMDGTKDDHIK